MTRPLQLHAAPGPMAIDPADTALLVVDMQNDFGAKGGLFDHAGIDISMIQAVVHPTASVLASARRVGIPIVYLKMGFQPDLSDLGSPDSPNRVRHSSTCGICSLVSESALTPRMALRAASSSAIPGIRKFFPSSNRKPATSCSTNTASAVSMKPNWKPS